MKKIIIVLTFLIMISNAYLAQESHGYAITLKGEKIELYGETSLGPYSISTNDKSGKWMSLKAKTIKYLILQNKVYFSIKAGVVWAFMEIVAFNDKYILTTLLEQEYGAAVRDRNFNLIEKHIPLSNGMNIHDNAAAKDRIQLNEKVKKYFEDCPELFQAFEDNLNKNVMFDKGIYYYNCGNATDPKDDYEKFRKNN